MQGIVSKHYNFINSLLEGRYLTLLVSLMLMILMPFFMEGSPYQEFSAVTLNGLCVLLCIYTIQESRIQLIIGLSLGVLVIVVNHFGFFKSSLSFDFYLSYSAYVLFYGYVAFRLLRMVINTERVRVGVLYAAVIVYLLIGVIGGYLFMIIEKAIPESIANMDISSLRNPSEFFYFSFITLSTLGYGDITPVNQVAKALSMVLSTTGPLYLTVLVALLVSRFEHSDLHL